MLNCSTVIFMGDWGKQGLDLVAKAVLGRDMQESAADMSADEQPLVLPNRKLVLEQMVGIYHDTLNLTRRIQSLKGLVYYISPSHFTHYCKHYVKIYRT
jgi:hypothetical protein